MTLRASAPVPSAPIPRAALLASPSKGRVDVDGSSDPAVEDSGTWVPATGGSLTLCFFGQPDSSAAPAISNAIDMTLFIYFSIQDSRYATRFVRVPAMGLFVYFVFTRAPT